MFCLVRDGYRKSLLRLCFLCLSDDDTRVRLERGSNDYINANYVEVPEADRRYILTQVTY